MTKRERLSDDRRDWAAPWYGYACKIAIRHARSWPEMEVEFKSDAGLALCRAALEHDATRHPPFGVYLARCVENAMIDAGRRARRRHEPLPSRMQCEGREPPVGRDLEHAEAFARKLSLLTPEEAEVVRLKYGEEVDLRDIAARSGRHHTRVYRRRDSALLTLWYIYKYQESA